MSDLVFEANERTPVTLSSKVVSIVMAVLYCGLLVYLYDIQVFRFYSYLGFQWDPTIPSVLIGLSLVLGIAFITPLDASARSAFIFLAAYMHFYPSIIYYALTGVGTYYLTILSFAIATFLLFSNFPAKRIVGTSMTWSSVLIMSIFFTVMTLGLLIAYTGLSNFNISFSEIYEFRSDSRGSLPGFMGYLRPITTKVFLPIFIILAFRSGRLSLILLSIGAVLLFFAYTNHKSVIGSSIVAVVLYFAIRKAKNLNFLSIIFVALLALCVVEVVIASLAFGYNGPAQLSTMVARRTLFVPPLLNDFHIDFFQSSRFTYWAQSSVGFGMVDRFYQLNTPFLIGDVYFGRDTMAANTGLIGSGYANAGLTGVIIYAAILGIAVSYLNEYGKKIGHGFIVGIAFTQIIGAINSSDLPSVFLTNGLATVFILVVFLPKAPTTSSGPQMTKYKT